MLKFYLKKKSKRNPIISSATEYFLQFFIIDIPMHDHFIEESHQTAQLTV
jgi:hypothetical protein